MTGEQMILIRPSALEQLQTSIDELKSLIVSKEKEALLGRWIESEEARKMLGVSPKTWQNYRDSRVIPFSQFGRKIYVKLSDINAFMESHIVRN